MFEKTVSEKQLAANRENARKSTGPKSEEGKNRSRRNAGRHHLTGQVITMTGEDHAAYVDFEKSFFEDRKPEGTLETALVHSIAHAFWRLNRAEAVEENYFSLQSEWNEHTLNGPNPRIQNAALQCMMFFRDPNKFVLLSLYEQRIHRRLEKDLSTLASLQSKRQAAVKPAPAERTSAAAAPCGPGTLTLTAEASTSSPENGFVFSTAPEPPARPRPETSEAPQTYPSPAQHSCNPPLLLRIPQVSELASD
ncbi:MAG: hypothetical protein KGN84_01385 [Acidobacteriota bacterium]|nr:hypothetical protein [Acidobacteriota bacterium]